MSLNIQGNLQIQGNFRVGYKIPTPIDLNFSALYETSDISHVTITGTNEVTSFRDQSGNNRHVSKVSSPYPLYGVEQINGLDTVSFDNGSNVYLTSIDSFFRIYGDITIFAVVKFKTKASTQIISSHSEGPTEIEVFNTIHEIGFASLSPGGRVYTFHEYTPTNDELWRSDILADDPSDCLVWMRRNATTKQWELGLKNVYQHISATQSYTNNPTGGTESAFFLGLNGSGGGQLKGSIGEYGLVNRRITDQELNYLKLYVNEKWGI